MSKVCGPYQVIRTMVSHGFDSRRRVAICDQTPNMNVLCWVNEGSADDVCASLNRVDGNEPAAPPPQSAEQPQGEGLTPEREAEIERAFGEDANGRWYWQQAAKELLLVTKSLRQQLAEAQRERDLATSGSVTLPAYHTNDAPRIVAGCHGYKCVVCKTEPTPHHLAKGKVYTPLCDKCLKALLVSLQKTFPDAALESRLQAAQGLVEKWRAMGFVAYRKCADELAAALGKG